MSGRRKGERATPVRVHAAQDTRNRAKSVSYPGDAGTGLVGSGICVCVWGGAAVRVRAWQWNSTKRASECPLLATWRTRARRGPGVRRRSTRRGRTRTAPRAGTWPALGSVLGLVLGLGLGSVLGLVLGLGLGFRVYG